MARLNIRPSATPQPGRASTVDSLYRDPSIPPPQDRHARQSTTFSAISPSQSMNSDKENDFPESREASPRPTKTRRMAPSASGQPPTPDSGPGNGNKRRRTGDYNAGNTIIYQEEDAQDIVEEEDENLRYYNPNQDPEKRRALRAGIRNNQRELEENRDELVQASDGRLLEQLHKQNVLFGKVRQTAEATLDSHFLVFASDLAGKKLKNSLHGNAGVGIDIDQFVSKCIFFMKSGGQTAGAGGAAMAAPIAGDDEEGEEDGDGLDWALLGREACFPSNKRPPVSSFLLGPLSVQKRVRSTQRRARSQRQPVGPVTRPQEIQESDIRQSENSNLTHLVRGIEKRLRNHILESSQNVESELSELDHLDPEDYHAACRRFRVCQAPNEEAAVSLLDFTINPNSFGQTVENLFYISFLIREGNAKVLFDVDGLPLLVPETPRNISEQREQSIQRNQAVFSIDWPTWQDFIAAFDIKEPLIPHRQEEQANVAPGGWYG